MLERFFGQHHPICQNRNKKNFGDSVLVQEMSRHVSSNDIVGLIERTLCGGHDRGIALRRDKVFPNLTQSTFVLTVVPPLPPVDSSKNSKMEMIDLDFGPLRGVIFLI